MAIYDVYGNNLASDSQQWNAPFWENNNNTYYWILHLDCARKYFTVANVKAILDAMSDAGMNQIQLHFSELQGFRLELDDMTVRTESGTTYDLEPALGGNENSNAWYTQSDMDEIIEYAHTLGIDVCPSFDMPDHMAWLLNHLGMSGRCIDVTNSTQVAFAKACAKKYAEYFRSRGCKFYSVGFDESGFSTYYNNNQYNYVVNFANDIASMLKDMGMIPRLYNDAVHLNSDFSYFFDRDFQILYWANKGVLPPTLQRMGYSMLNNTIQLYWVSSGQQVTAETIEGLDLLKGFHGAGLPKGGNGAVLSIWCDYDSSDVNNGDGGDYIVTAITPLIEAFGENLMSI